MSMYIDSPARGVLGKLRRVGCRLVPALLVVFGFALQPCAASILLHVGCDEAATHYPGTPDLQPDDGCASAEADELTVTEAAKPLGKDARVSSSVLILAGHFDPVSVAALNARSARLAGNVRLPAPLHPASWRLLL